jgi:hypothetical protein
MKSRREEKLHPIMAHPTTAEYYCDAIRDVTQTIDEKCQVER